MRLRLKTQGIYTIPATTVYKAIYSDMQLNTSEFQNILPKVMKEMQPAISEEALFGGDLGLGFDLGLTYYLKNIQFTASILDVGLLSKDVETFTGYYKYEGINPNFNSTDLEQRLSAV
jgi:hypothetical protein